MEDLSGSETSLSSKKKSRPGSLRRAFSWLRLSGRKKRKTLSEGDKPAAKPPPDPRAHTAGSKLEDEAKWSVHYRASQYQHQQENIFLPTTRPQHIEELHKEAELGLKSLQEQAKLDGYSELHLGNGRDSTGNCSQHSQDDEGSGPPVDGDEVWAKTRSLPPPTPDEARRNQLCARPTAAPTGTTFKPQVSSRGSVSHTGSKLKEKRIRRTTIMGLPQHVQKELGLGLGRSPSLLDTNKDVNDSAGTVCAGRTGGEGGSGKPALPGQGTSLRSVDSVGTKSNCTLTGSDRQHWGIIDFSNRPKSLAIPRGSIPNELLQSPVMCMSPQATYMSKIIPNAILPAAVDVVMIHASHSSLRTLSRTSLLFPASPACARSLHNYGVGDYASSDTWSHSESSETIVSDSSTISSRGSRADSQSRAAGVTGRSEAELDIPSSVRNPQPRTSAAPPSLSDDTRPEMNGHAERLAGTATGSTGGQADGSDTQSVTSERSVTRNLSVKKMKRPPAPPKRGNSAQPAEPQQQELGLEPGRPAPPAVAPRRKDPCNRSMSGEDEVFSPTLSETVGCRLERSPDSPAFRGSASPPAQGAGGSREVAREGSGQNNHRGSPSNPTSPDRFERTMSPSSGYSSQSGTPTLTRELVTYSSSPGGQRRSKPKTPARSSSLYSPEMSNSSSLTSLSSTVSECIQPDLVDPLTIPPPPSAPAPAPPPIKMSKFLMAELFPQQPIIPPPPQGPAPPPPAARGRVIPRASAPMGITAPLVTAPLVNTAPVAPGVTVASIAPVAPVVTTVSVAPVVTTVPVAPVVTSVPVAPVVTSVPVALVTSPVAPVVTSPVAPVVTSPVAPVVTSPVAPVVTSPVAPVVTSPVAPVVTVIPVATSAPPKPVQQEPSSPQVKRSSPPPSPPPSHHPPPPVKKTPVNGVKSSSSSNHLQPVKPEKSTVDWPAPPPPMSPMVLSPSPGASILPAAVAVSSGKTGAQVEDTDFLFPPPPPPVFADKTPEKTASSKPPEKSQPEPSICPAPSASPVENKPSRQSVATEIVSAQRSTETLSLKVPTPTSAPIASPADPPQQKPSAVSGPSADPSQQSPVPAAQLHKTANQTPKAYGQDSKSQSIAAQPSSNEEVGGQASIPIVTPSLLQMVRLRSVQMGAFPTGVLETKPQPSKTQPPNRSSQTAPSKPVRKSLSLRLSSSDLNPPPPSPSQHGSVDGKSPTAQPSEGQGHHSLKPPEDGAALKSPASMASFIFSKNTSHKKLFFDVPKSPEAEAQVQRNLMAELNSVSERIISKVESRSSGKQQRSKAAPEAARKPGKVPPPVAKKPAFLLNPQRPPSTSTEGTGTLQETAAQAARRASDAKDVTDASLGRDQTRSTRNSTADLNGEAEKSPEQQTAGQTRQQ
eukprot:gi/632972149/ref/XP_007902518.1/ PREDICTED: uncharacterized protein KIAA1522 homolog [Callorhinchus milii]